MNLMHPCFPAFIDLQDALVCVIGGGRVAEHKIGVLADYGARLRVISPQVTPKIAVLAAEGSIELEQREYREGDLSDARLCICACNNPDAEEAVLVEAHRRNCLVNVVDQPEKCDFMVPSIVRRGPLQIAVSTSGTSPLNAKRIRKDLETRYDGHWERYLLLLGEVRGLVRTLIPNDEHARHDLLASLQESNLEQRIAQGENLTAQQVVDSYLATSETGSPGKMVMQDRTLGEDRL